MFSNIFGTVSTKPYFDIHNRLQNLLNEKGNRAVMHKASNVIPMASVSKPEVFITIQTATGIIDQPREHDVKNTSNFIIVVLQYGYDGYKNVILEIMPEHKWFSK